jgi:hypothetical protein
MSPHRTLLLGIALSLGGSGCRHAMCDPRPVGAPWRRYELLLPVNTVVCGPNRVSARKPSNAIDDYPPTQVFVFYRDATPEEAFAATLRRFEATGWTVAGRKVLGDRSNGVFTASVFKNGTQISITVNDNDWGIQGSFELREGPR